MKTLLKAVAVVGEAPELKSELNSAETNAGKL